MKLVIKFYEGLSVSWLTPLKILKTHVTRYGINNWPLFQTETECLFKK